MLRYRTGTAHGEAVTCSSPPPIYTTHGAFMKPRITLYNRPSEIRAYGDGGREMRVLFSTYSMGVWL
jgi:hypothetical protein